MQLILDRLRATQPTARSRHDWPSESSDPRIRAWAHTHGAHSLGWALIRGSDQELLCLGVVTGAQAIGGGTTLHATYWGKIAGWDCCHPA